jgi:hypothetical protein
MFFHELKEISPVFFPLALIMLTVVSCDNTIDPLDRDQGIYSVYGYLDLNEETHYIRVKDLNAPFTAEATEQLDATVTLRNLGSGHSAVLAPEIMEYEGVYLHTFVYNSVVVPDNNYQVTVERSDGAVVELVTRTPTKPGPRVEPVNEYCDVPVVFKLAPLNGGTVVLRFGYDTDPRRQNAWGPSVVIRGDPDQPSIPISHTFIPHEELSRILPFVPPANIRCNVYLTTGNLFISYIHYAPGFYEQFAGVPFDAITSTHRFGALYYDTLAVPIDLSDGGDRVLQKEIQGDGGF